MFYILLIAAATLFVLHVGLLLAAFPNSELAQRRYFFSHLTLWLTGLMIFIMAVLYSGSGRSGFLDYFDTPLKKVMILAFTLALSLVAHTIVRLAVLPLLRKNRA
jgi:SNF family Na+-dependent transporter